MHPVHHTPSLWRQDREAGEPQQGRGAIGAGGGVGEAEGALGVATEGVGGGGVVSGGLGASVWGRGAVVSVS